MQNLPTLILIAAMVVVFYLLILRPQKRRQQAIQQTLSSLAAGDRVLLGSGVFGTIVALGERQAVLEISPGVEMTVLKQAIARKVTEADEDAEYDDELDDDEDELEDLTEPDGPVQPAPLPEQPRSAGADTSRLG
jgi:preprotein translocase subunit YajC